MIRQRFEKCSNLGPRRPRQVSYVIPEFSNPLGHLRAKACWVAGMYADIPFAEPSNFRRLLGAVVGSLRDTELPARGPSAAYSHMD
jgi:hypothetical protein